MMHAKPKDIGKYLFWGVASAFLAAFLAWSVVPASLTVDVTPIERGALDVWITGEGVMHQTNPSQTDPSQMDVVVDLLSTDAARIQVGAEVVIGKGGGRELHGHVRRLEAQRLDVIVDFDDPAQLPQTLGHGVRVAVGILEWSGDDVLKAPLSALFRTDEGWAVFVKDANRARLAHVQVGHMNSQEAEIVTGLSAGDQVIEHPGERLKDGVQVTARKP